MTAHGKTMAPLASAGGALVCSAAEEGWDEEERGGDEDERDGGSDREVRHGHAAFASTMSASAAARFTASQPFSAPDRVG